MNKAVNLPALSEQNSQFLEDLMKKLADNAKATLIFADPVEREGMTIIPVAKMMWGFGGGGGSDKKNAAGGTGGAGGIRTIPVGFIQLKGGKARFQPIFDAGKIIMLFAVWGLLGYLIVRRMFPSPKAKMVKSPPKGIPATTTTDEKVAEPVTVGKL